MKTLTNIQELSFEFDDIESIEDISNLLGIHRNSVANKLNGYSSFSIDQSMKIQETYFPDLELRYLFKKEEMEV